MKLLQIFEEATINRGPMKDETVRKRMEAGAREAAQQAQKQNLKGEALLKAVKDAVWKNSIGRTTFAQMNDVVDSVMKEFSK